MRQFLWAQIKKHFIIASIVTAIFVILIFDLSGLTGNAWIMNISAFVIGLCTLLFIETKKHSKLTDKIIRPIGFILVFCIVLIVEAYTRYELQTTFYKPCWSTDGKQISFFMEKALYRYHLGLPFSLWSPDDIWKKYYLCTMDYDGGNFKQIKETDSQGFDRQKYLEYYSVMWPNTETIVYNQKMEDNFHSGKYQGKSYKIHPDGSGLEELWKWNEKSEYQDVYWLTPKEEYLILAKNNDIGRIYAIYDRKEKNIKKEVLFSGKLYGSYKDNTIAISNDRYLMIVDLDSLTTKKIDRNEIEILKNLLVLDGFEYSFASRSYSPDRKMYAEAGGIWTVGNNKVVSAFYVKPKCSYLFNIFPK